MASKATTTLRETRIVNIPPELAEAEYVTGLLSQEVNRKLQELIEVHDNEFILGKGQGIYFVESQPRIGGLIDDEKWPDPLAEQGIKRKQTIYRG